VALEGKDGFEALQRSRTLTSGAKWRILWGVILLGLPYEALAFTVPEAVASFGPMVVGAARACCLIVTAMAGAFLVEVYRAQGGEAIRERKPREDAGAAG
jgi:hypothetical protein